MTNDSPQYLEKKKFFDKILTVFGRKPVLEALSDPSLTSYCLHLAESNKPAAILKEIVSLAEGKNVEVKYHSKQALSRISKNAKQDQGIALDIHLNGFSNTSNFFNGRTAPFKLIALDNVTNPQNLGMIIRSVCASPLTGLLLPQKGCATLDSLVIKASAGTLFKAQIIRCDSLQKGLQACKNNGATIYGLDANADYTLANAPTQDSQVFVLGNETDGVSKEVRELCDKMLAIPMSNGVESLNVAVTASLLAFRSVM